jgi:signal transduction histidine kinase
MSFEVRLRGERGVVLLDPEGRVIEATGDVLEAYQAVAIGERLPVQDIIPDPRLLSLTDLEGPELVQCRLQRGTSAADVDLLLLPLRESEQTLGVLYVSGSCKLHGRVTNLEAFYASTAHRLGNLLPVSIDNATLVHQLSHGTLPRPAESALGLLTADLKQACEVVRELKTFARSFHCPLDSTGLVREALDPVIEYLKSTFGHNARVTSELRAGPALLRYNAQRLKEIFVSFVADSIHYRNPAEIRVEARSTSGGIQLVYLDHGPGVPAHLKETIFQPFWSSRQGAGIGMHYARCVVQAHGGTIRENGIPEAGIRLEINLPRADSA